jgi:hypothetical protein
MTTPEDLNNNENPEINQEAPEQLAMQKFDEIFNEINNKFSYVDDI